MHGYFVKTTTVHPRTPFGESLKRFHDNQTMKRIFRTSTCPTCIFTLNHRYQKMQNTHANLSDSWPTFKTPISKTLTNSEAETFLMYANDS